MPPSDNFNAAHYNIRLAKLVTKLQTRCLGAVFTNGFWRGGAAITVSERAKNRQEQWIFSLVLWALHALCRPDKASVGRIRTILQPTSLITVKRNDEGKIW